MAFIEIKDMSFAYPNAERLALDSINLKINKGELVLICGRSGSGKTTLLRRLKPVISPHGSVKGGIFYLDRPIDSLSEREQAAEIGFVMQNPDDQAVTDKVWHELVFGLESLGMSRDEIRLRAAETAAYFGIEAWFRKSVVELSGGQKQLLNLASAMALRPSVLILDEPSSQLDPLAALEFTDMLKRINTELGVTVIISEHRLEDIYPKADRVIVMEAGRIISDAPPAAACEYLYLTNHPMIYALPSAARIGAALGESGCLTVSDAARALRERDIHACLTVTEPKREEPILEAKELYFKYEKNAPDILEGLSFKLARGDIFALLGGNGSGKTTTLKLLSGMLRPYYGKVKARGRILMLPQEPADLFTEKTVYDDLRRITRDKEKIEKTAALTEITDILSMHPYDISGGEIQRAALAKLLLAEPDILLLDEPTKGIDSFFKRKLGTLLRELTKNGLTVLMVSHDTEFCAEYATHCAMLFDRGIASEGEPHRFFLSNAFYTPAAVRIAKGCVENAVTTPEVIKAIGGSEPEPTNTLPPPRSSEGLVPEKAAERARRSANIRTAIALLIIFVLMPLTIYFGITVLNDRKYYFISMLILFFTAAPFFMIFEDRIVRTRELMLIAMLCALACIGRSAFFMMHEFKPVCAIVIIAGVCLGAESGFMVGAVSGFVSNFFFGQGPWTPWQMFGFGIIGFIAGLAYRFGLIRKTAPSLAVFGFLSVLFIYGGIMNPASVIMYQPEPTLSEILLAYASGFPIDLIHAAGTGIFMVLIGKTLIEKIERVKIKFGLIDSHI